MIANLFGKKAQPTQAVQDTIEDKAPPKPIIMQNVQQVPVTSGGNPVSEPVEASEPTANTTTETSTEHAGLQSIPLVTKMVTSDGASSEISPKPTPLLTQTGTTDGTSSGSSTTPISGDTNKTSPQKPENETANIEDAKIENEISIKPTKSKSKSGYSMFGFKSKSLPMDENLCDDETMQIIKRQIMSPCKQGEPPIRCFIERDKGMMGLYPVFRLFLEADAEGNPEKFLISAKKNVKAATPYFSISTDSTPADKESQGALGKLRGNDKGTQFILYDKGMNPDKIKEKDKETALLRQELGVVRFPSNTTAPLNYWLPSVRPDGTMDVWQPKDAVQGTIEKAIDDGQTSNLSQLTNKVGENLDYKGRVTEESTKNFQLVDINNSDDVILLFGKTKKDRFAMDVSYPLSIYQAFSICIAIMDKTSNSNLKYR